MVSIVPTIGDVYDNYCSINFMDHGGGEERESCVRIVSRSGSGRWFMAATLVVIVLLLTADILWAEHAPVHMRLRSSGVSAVLTVDGVTYPFMWPAPPTRLALLANDPNTHEWGIGGSQSLWSSPSAPSSPSGLGRAWQRPRNGQGAPAPCSPAGRLPLW